MLLLIDDQHASALKKYFGIIVLDTIKSCNNLDSDFMMMDVLYLKLSKIVYDLQRGVLAVEIAMIKLLELSTTEGITVYEKNLLKGIACMLNFLPAKEVDAKKLGESELWSTYHNPLLSSLLSNPQENILLRWTNKAAECYISKRPDAIISTFNNNQEVCLTYGECKLGGVSLKALNMGIVKLAIFTQRTININNKKRVFSFNIDGFKTNFYATSIENESVYVMKKLGDLVLPRCLNDLPSFVNMKTVNDMLQISKYFWETCNEDLDASQLSWKYEAHHEEYLDYVNINK